MAGRAPVRPAGAPGVPPVGIGLTFGKCPKGSVHQGALYAPPPPAPRTKWTRRVPHPVLIGHAASLGRYVKAMAEGGPADLSRLVRAGDILFEVVPCAPLPARPCPRPTSELLFSFNYFIHFILSTPAVALQVDGERVYKLNVAQIQVRAALPRLGPRAPRRLTGPD
jgi:hypothetical protein